MLVLLTRVLLWASIGLLLWYMLARIIPRKYLTWFGGVILILLLVISFLESDNDTVRILWQIISFPLTPLGASLVLLGSALTEGVKNTRGNPVAIALAILLICSIPLSAQWLVGQAEQSVRTAYLAQRENCGEVCPAGIPTRANLSNVGAIVVLGDSNDIDKAIALSETASSDVSINTALAPRLIYAGNLYQQARFEGSDPLIVVTAGVGPENEDAGAPQREVIRSIIRNNGGDGAEIRVEDSGIDIRTSASRVESILEDRQVIASRSARTEPGSTRDDPRVVVIAPAMLMPRAALTFERMNLQVIAKPTDFYTAQFEDDGGLLELLPQILPSADALQLTTHYWNELLTSLYYFLRGWLPNFNFGWNSSIEI
ncbi:MAG: ElyC/SanA/YdcF family protein [Phormidesmis sp.]